MPGLASFAAAAMRSRSQGWPSNQPVRRLGDLLVDFLPRVPLYASHMMGDQAGQIVYQLLTIEAGAELQL